MTTDTTPLSGEDIEALRSALIPIGAEWLVDFALHQLHVVAKLTTEAAAIRALRPDELAQGEEKCPECGGTRSQFPNAWPPETYRHAYPCKACGQMSAAAERDPHPRYGPCDALGPRGACSECTGMIERDDGSVVRFEGMTEMVVSTDSELASAEMRIAELEKALEEIARQKLVAELPEEEWGDFEEGYDECVLRARAALAKEQSRG